MINEIQQLYGRDLLRLHKEIAAFRQEEHLWQTAGQVPNPAGNLGLHLVGNLCTYIGKNLGNIPYARDREAEFATRNVPQPVLLAQIETTRQRVHATLQQMESGALRQPYPEDVFGHEMTTGFFLLHLLAHLSYHTGQINYLRRTLE